MNCFDRLPAGWQFIYDRHIQIAVIGHRQCSRNGGSCHDKYVRRLVILGPHTGTLFHTKRCCSSMTTRPRLPNTTVSSMSAWVPSSRWIPPSAIPASTSFFPSLHRTCEQSQLYIKWCQQGGERFPYADEPVSLLAPSGRPVIIINRHQHRHQCHQRFTASHIAMQQPVHLMAAHHIFFSISFNTFSAHRSVQRRPSSQRTNNPSILVKGMPLNFCCRSVLVLSIRT